MEMMMILILMMIIIISVVTTLVVKIPIIETNYLTIIIVTSNLNYTTENILIEDVLYSIYMYIASKKNGQGVSP